MRVNDEYIAGQDEDRGIAVGEGGGFGQRGKHAVGYFFDVEEIGGRCRRLGARPAGAKKGLLEDGGSGEDATEAAVEEIAARMVLMSPISVLSIYQSSEGGTRQ